jgi:hypothetical protein
VRALLEGVLAMNPKRQTYCDCQGRVVDNDDCDRCDWDPHLEDDYEDPPLYADGYIAALTPEQLIAERDRQNRIHDAAVDRCEEINSPTIESAQMRGDIVRRELERRGLNPHADKPEPKR